MASFDDSARTRANEGSRAGTRGIGRERASRPVFADLSEVGYELTEQHLQMISGGAAPQRGVTCCTSPCGDCDCD